MKLKHASYKKAVAWIAFNDDATEMDSRIVESQITVMLIADIFGTTEKKVASDVVDHREKHDVGPYK